MSQDEMAQKIEALEAQLNQLKEQLQTMQNKSTEQETKLQEMQQEVQKKVEQQVTDSIAERVNWDNGLRFNLGDAQLKIGGRIQNDWFIPLGDDDVDLDDSQDFGTEFRRARLFISGELQELYEFKLQFDFADGDADLKDAFVGLVNLDTSLLDGIRIGHFKEPFSLEELTSSKYITFLERGLPNAFAPSRNTGAMVYNSYFDDRLTWQVGGFKITDDFGNGQGDGGFSATGRITGLPWRADAQHFLHLGGALSYRASEDDDLLSFSQRPESSLANRVVDTGDFSAENSLLTGAELALVYGPWSLQSEYMINQIDAAISGAPEPDFTGWYVSGSYFLTGESRPWDGSDATFGRVVPHRPFGGEEGGLGAWEVALRFSQIDLSDDGILGGESDDITAALNWYPTDFTRVMFNYVYADVENPILGIDDNEHLVQGRLQIDF